MNNAILILSSRSVISLSDQHQRKVELVEMKFYK